MQEAINYFIPPVGERLFIAGQSGSGKTFFLERLVSATPNRYKVILDVKAEFNKSLFPEHYIARAPSELKWANVVGKKVIIYQPAERLMRDPEAWESVLSYVYHRGNTELIVDEMYGLSDPERPTRFPDSLHTIITRGRSKGITGYFCSQRPSGIPLVCISESQHVACFRLNMPNDRKRMAEATGQPEFQEGVQNLPLAGKLTGHEFLWYTQANSSVGVFCLQK